MNVVMMMRQVDEYGLGPSLRERVLCRRGGTEPGYVSAHPGDAPLAEGQPGCARLQGQGEATPRQGAGAGEIQLPCSYRPISCAGKPARAPAGSFFPGGIFSPLP